MNTTKIGRIMVFLIGGVMALTGVLKIVGGEEAAAEFGNANVPYILAAVQFLIATTIFLPRTRLLGIILAASYFGGVICFQWLVEGELPIVGAAINAVLYIGAALYYPALQDGSEKTTAE